MYQYRSWTEGPYLETQLPLLENSKEKNRKQYRQARGESNATKLGGIERQQWNMRRTLLKSV